MGLTFYPIEDDAFLETFRQRLCPFMKAIQKTTKSDPISYAEREKIFDEIVRSARANKITNQLSGEWYQFIHHPSNETLDAEHGNLIAMNLK